MNNKVITRFAPSPTGLPHIGTAMYAILNYLHARQNNGEVIMRSEDTDPARSKREYEEAIIEGLAWLGIKADSFYRQSERTEIYKKYISKMVTEGSAYLSKEKNEEGVERELVRFKNPNKVVTFNDASRGDISVDTTDLGDFIIARDIESPLYHLTVVVDDHETGVTHIIRGEDGIANTPRQILIQEAIGATRPVYAHYPFVLLPDKTKMGKRNGAVSLQDYRARGYLPEAIVNFIILMAWHPKDDRELFTLEELLKEFELGRIGKSGAILDETKLNWINKEYLKKLSDAEYENGILAFKPDSVSSDLLKKLLPDLKERVNVFGELTAMAEAGEFDFYTNAPSPNEALIVSNTKVSIGEIKEYMAEVARILEGVEMFSKENIKAAIWDFATEKGRGNVLWPMRVILTGKEKSPDPFTVAETLGKEETIKRLANVK